MGNLRAAIVVVFFIFVLLVSSSSSSSSSSSTGAQRLLVSLACCAQLIPSPVYWQGISLYLTIPDVPVCQCDSNRRTHTRAHTGEDEKRKKNDTTTTTTATTTNAPHQRLTRSRIHHANKIVLIKLKCHTRERESTHIFATRIRVIPLLVLPTHTYARSATAFFA